MNGQQLILRSHIIIEADDGADEFVLLDGHSGTMYSCNATAAALVTKLARGTTEDKLVATLCETFPVDADRAQRDVGALLDSLNAVGFVQQTIPSSRRISRAKLPRALRTA